MSGDGPRSYASGPRAGLRELCHRQIQSRAQNSSRSSVRSQRTLHVYIGNRVADSVSEDMNHEPAGKFARGWRVTFLMMTLSAGLGVPGAVGAPMIISAFLIPSITRPKTVYFLSKAGCFFRVMNH